MTGAAWGAIVLAGGSSRRWGGLDKTAATFAGRPVLLHAVAAVLPGAAALVVVAPAEHPARSQVELAANGARCALAWVREDPPGGGPAAGLAAGLTALDALDPLDPLNAVDPGRRIEQAVVLAGDLVFAGSAVPRLLAALALPDADADIHADIDAAVGLDPGGRRQPLLAAYHVPALRGRLAGLVTNVSMRSILAGLRVAEVAVTAQEAFDLYTPRSLTEAESGAGREAGWP